MAPVEVDSSSVWDGKNLGLLRVKARIAYQKIKEAVNAATGRTIVFVNRGYTELRAHSADSRTLRIVPQLRALMEQAIPIISEAETDAMRRQRGIVAWHHYAVKASLDGEPVYVRLTAFERKDGALYVDVFHDGHVTSEADMQKDPTVRPSSTANEAQSQSGLSADRLYQWWHSVKPPESGQPSAVSDQGTDTGTVREGGGRYGARPGEKAIRIRGDETGGSVVLRERSAGGYGSEMSDQEFLESLPLGMPDELKREIMSWDYVSKSPYSESYYNLPGKTWENDPPGIKRVSDHWNFWSRGTQHLVTDRPVENNSHWTLAQHDPAAEARGEPKLIGIRFLRRGLKGGTTSRRTVPFSLSTRPRSAFDALAAVSRTPSLTPLASCCSFRQQA